jgi:hypothetical protein
VKLDYLTEPGLRLCVRDDGRGFDQTRVIGGGLGLRAMHERAERIGATFTLITESGQGTEVIVLWMSEDANTGTETNRLKETLRPNLSIKIEFASLLSMTISSCGKVLQPSLPVSPT